MSNKKYELIEEIKTLKDGTRKHYRNGKLHRIGGPAVEWSDGEQWYYRNGKLHRTGGPAVDYRNGEGWYYLEGIAYTEDGHRKTVKVLHTVG